MPRITGTQAAGARAAQFEAHRKTKAKLPAGERVGTITSGPVSSKTKPVSTKPKRPAGGERPGKTVKPTGGERPGKPTKPAKPAKPAKPTGGERPGELKPARPTKVVSGESARARPSGERARPK